MAKELTETIKENAQGPAEVTGDSGSMKQQPPTQVIESDRYLRSVAATRRKNRGLNIAKLSPPGAS